MPKNNLPEWYVFYHSHIEKRIKKLNIFDHSTFAQKYLQILKRKLSREEFAKEVESILFYHYNSKFEYEVIISSLCESKNRDEEIKVDVYEQIKLNWDIFIDYIYDFK